MSQNLMYYLSAEFLLRKCANGGDIIFYRTLIITFLFYAMAIGVRSYTNPAAVFDFSYAQLKIEIFQTLPWLGAIFAGVYAALYSRFVSQWNYLANFYNQIMHMLVTVQDSDLNKKQLASWQASFVEDAFELHLACKSMFYPMVKTLLEDADVRKAFQENATEGMKKSLKLKQLLEIYP